MNIIRRSLLLSLTLIGTINAVRAQTPYLETAPLSILWNFTITGVNGTTVPLPPDPVPGPVVPGRPTDRISTDIGSPITFGKKNGHQQFFVDKTIIHLINLYKFRAAALQVEAEALAEDDPQRLVLLDQAEYWLYLVEYLNDNKTGRWEFTAVRQAQSTLAGALSTPFQIFLTRIDPLMGRPSLNFLTDFILSPIASAANVTEKLHADPENTAAEIGRVTKATGNATIHLRAEFECFDVEAKEYWLAFGSAYLTCNIRSTPGPLAAVALAKPSITGHGTWVHTAEEGSYGGVAPLAIKMGEAKYQNSQMFPDFDFDLE